MKLIGHWEPCRLDGCGFMCTEGVNKGYFMLMVRYEKGKWHAMWWDWGETAQFIRWDAEFDTMEEAKRYAETLYQLEHA